MQEGYVESKLKLKQTLRLSLLGLTLTLLLIQVPEVLAASQASVASTTAGGYSSCLVQVPYNATIGNSGYWSGDEVTFANGTKLMFPFYSCQRAVYPDVYSIALNIANNPEFVADEAGQLYSIQSDSFSGDYNYTASQTCTTTSVSGIGNVNPPECLVNTVVVFQDWTNHDWSCCGYTIPYLLTGEIDVYIPFNSTGGPELGNMFVKEDLNPGPGVECLCTSVTTSISTSTIGPTTLIASEPATTTITVTKVETATSDTFLGALTFLLVAALVAVTMFIRSRRGRVGRGLDP